MISSKFPSSTISRKSIINFRLLRLKREIQLIIDEIEKEDDYRFATIALKLQLMQYELDNVDSTIYDVNGKEVSSLFSLP